MANPSMAITITPDNLSVSVKQEHIQSPHEQPKPQQSEELAIAVQPPQKEPQFLKSISQLGNLSTAVDAFIRRFHELQKHLDFIQSALDTRSTVLSSSPDQQPQTTDKPTTKETQTEVTTKDLATKAALVAPTQPQKSEVRSFCEMMCGKGLRKYVVSNLSNVAKLREEVPSALLCAPKPAKLVLDCMGRFFLQGSRAYDKASPMIAGREASILVLEFFLQMMESGVAVEAAVKLEAEQAAVAWRKRLVVEGGLSRASEIDARGLLLLVACYGIPKLFSNDDVWHLILSSHSAQFAGVLQRSRLLVSRVTDIIEGMMKKGMKLEAVDVACTFGIDDMFPPQKILNSFMQQSMEALKNQRIDANNSPILLKEANENHLAGLKSVIKFLEERKLDHSKLLPSWQFKEKITKLEKDIAYLNKIIDDKVIAKRKADENELSNSLRIQEIKRSRFTAKGSPLVSPSTLSLHDQRAVSYVDVQSSYNGSVRMNLLDGGFSGHFINYPTAPSGPYVSGTGSLTDNVLGMMAGGGRVMHTAGVGVSAVYGMPSTGSSAEVHREMLVARAGQVLGNGGHPYGWNEVEDAAFNERSLGQIRQPTSGLYKPSPSIKGFAGLPNSSPTIHTNQNSASDLYGFADSVVEGAYNGTHRAGLPPVVGSHHSSYLY